MVKKLQRKIMLYVLLTMLIISPFLPTIKAKPTDVRSAKNIKITTSETPSSYVGKAPREWTFMVYLDGDNNLESAAIDDFLEMSSVGSTTDVAIVTLFDRWSNASDPDDDTSYGNWTTAKIFYVDYGETPYASNADEDWGERNMGNPSTLFDFINYSITNYPAEKYILVLWDHGGGYFGACWDEDNGDDNLNLTEIRTALKNVYESLGIKIDIVGFDACLVGTIETAYALKDYVDIVVFSEEYEPGDGWPYDDILNTLKANPTMSPEDLATEIVDDYINYYTYSNADVTMSAVNVSYVAMYTFAAINRVAGYLLRHYSTFSSSIIAAIDATETFSYSWLKDIKHFFINLKNRVSDATLIDLLDESISKIDGAIIDYGHLSNHPNAYGLSAHISYDYYFVMYDYLLSSEYHQWDQFQRRVYGASPGIWFYDIKFYGFDYDGDGAYATDLAIYVDLDVLTSATVYVTIYGYNGTHEEVVGDYGWFTISGASSSDAKNISISVSSNATYSFRIEVYDGSDTIQFYYYCDANISNIPLETSEPIVDVVPPDIDVYSPENNTYHNTSFISLYWTYSDNIEVDHIEIKIDSGSWQNIGIRSDYDLYGLSEGRHDIYVKAVDIAGNENIYHLVVFIDLTRPSIEIISPSNNTYINDTTLVLEWNAYDDNLDYLEVFLNGTKIAGPITTNSYTLYNLDDGYYFIEVRAVDKAGNRNSSMIIIIVDMEPPTVEVKSPSNGSTMTECNIEFILNISDNMGIDRVIVFINGSKIKEMETNYENFTIKFNESAYYVIKIVVYDKAGNSADTTIIIVIHLSTGGVTSIPRRTTLGILDLNTLIPMLIIFSLIIIAVFILLKK